MSEEELWLSETDPLRLLELRYPMRSEGSDYPQQRQSRLYLLACARKQWARLPPVCRVIVWLGEVFVDAQREQRRALLNAVVPVVEELMHSEGAPDDLRSAELRLRTAEPIAAELAQAQEGANDPAGSAPGPPLEPEEWIGVAALLHLAFAPRTPPYVWVPTELHDVELLRDVYGNPYRHVLFPAAWRTDRVVAFARGMYESRDFSAMPIFADLLQDTGCDCDDILDHCRAPGPHARGCWVCDLVLEK